MRKGDHLTELTSTTTSPKELLWAVFIRLTLSPIAMGVLLFGSAGSLRYWNGWLFLVTVFVLTIIFAVYFYKKDPSLFKKRMKIHEEQKEQRTYSKLMIALFPITFLVAGFDYRFGGSHVPLWLVAVSFMAMVFGYILIVIVMVQNTFASRVIEIQQNQRVIDTGLYSFIRHPMYMAATIMCTAWPLVLGSYYALIPILLLPVVLVYRIKNEEVVLRAGLDGYREYAKRVRYRLIPFVW